MTLKIIYLFKRFPKSVFCKVVYSYLRNTSQ